MWLFNKTTIFNDEELIAEYYKTGNQQLIGKLFSNHVKTIYGVCLFYFKDKDIAKDHVMQITEKLFSELKKKPIQHFKAWLSFVVRNHCISELRKNKNKHFVSETYLDFELNLTTLEDEQKIESVNDEDLLQHLREVLPKLKDKQRICIEYFYLNNKSYQEIAELTSFSINEIKSYIQNGKRNLKLLIEEKINKSSHGK